VLPLLSAARAFDLFPDASGLLQASYDWLMSQKRGVPGVQFGAVYAPGRPTAPVRSAWCYGDPGVALALWNAAHWNGNTAWRQEAVALAQGVTRRPAAECGVVDASLCHGSAGLGHIMNRFFQWTGDAAFRQSADHWFSHLLDQRRAHPGDAGLRTLFPDFFNAAAFQKGLGDGAVGAALALIAAASQAAPDWDACMLMSLLP